MFHYVTRSLSLALLALIVSITPVVAAGRTLYRQQQLSSSEAVPTGLKITLPTHDLNTSSIRTTSTGFTLNLTNNLAVFYSISPSPSAVSSHEVLWSRGLLGPKQKVAISVALTTSGQGVLLELNPTTSRAVTLDELVMAIDLVEVYLGMDVDPVAVLDAAPDLISVGTELLGASDYSAPLGALQKILSADSMQARAQAVMGLSTSMATVLAKPALLKQLAPLLAAGLSGASGKTVTPASVKAAMTGLSPVLNGLSRLIIGGRIGAMFVDFGKLIAERVSSPDNNAFAPLIPFRLTVGTTIQPTKKWNLAHDFRTYPNQKNPNPDSYGDSHVWYFMESGSLSHDPTSYTLLPSFTKNEFFVDGLQAWHGPVASGNNNFLPLVGLNTTGFLQHAETITWPAGDINVHPLPDRMVAVGWRSPISGEVAAGGSVNDLDATCGDGVKWYIDRGSSTVIQGVLPNGGHQSFAAKTKVGTGEFLYFIVSPNANYWCDSTGLNINIVGR